MPVALITGASSGIGAEYARQLAYGGYDVVLVARRIERLNALADSITAQFGVNASSIAADLTRDEDIATVVDYLRANPIDLLVSNAGIGLVGHFADEPLKDQLRVNRLHIDATIHLTYAALAGMRQRKRGAIILVSSFGGFVAGPNSAVYNATKAYLNSFGEALSYEVRKDRITVQVVCPGFTKTEIFDVSGVGMEDVRKNVPDLVWLTSPEVVTESLAALTRGQRIVVPGQVWRMARFLLTRVPFVGHLFKLYMASAF